MDSWSDGLAKIDLRQPAPDGFGDAGVGTLLCADTNECGSLSFAGRGVDRAALGEGSTRQ